MVSGCQSSSSLSYNDTARFFKKNNSRSYYFNKVKRIWTVSRKHSRMRVDSKKMFLTLKKETSCSTGYVSVDSNLTSGIINGDGSDEIF